MSNLLLFNLIHLNLIWFCCDRVDCLDDFPSGSFPNYNHNKYGDKPGQLWSADDQCRLLLRDRQAYVHYASAAALQVHTINLN